MEEERKLKLLLSNQMADLHSLKGKKERIQFLDALLLFNFYRSLIEK